jgi:hypothetical protein
MLHHPAAMAKDTTTALLAGGATAALLAALIVLVRTHLLPTGHNPVRDAVSDYGRWSRASRPRCEPSRSARSNGFSTSRASPGFCWSPSTCSQTRPD